MEAGDIYKAQGMYVMMSKGFDSDKWVITIIAGEHAGKLDAYGGNYLIEGADHVHILRYLETATYIGHISELEFDHVTS